MRLKKYTFLIGDNIIYNHTQIYRVRWFNFLFAGAGLCNVKKVTVKSKSAELARISAAIVFETVYGRYPQIMGQRIKVV